MKDKYVIEITCKDDIYRVKILIREYWEIVPSLKFKGLIYTGNETKEWVTDSPYEIDSVISRWGDKVKITQDLIDQIIDHKQMIIEDEKEVKEFRKINRKNRENFYK